MTVWKLRPLHFYRESRTSPFEGGYIPVSELEAFIRANGNERFADRKSRWIVEGLGGLPGWDRVIDSGGAEHYGILAGEGLTLADELDGKRFVSYEQLNELRISRGGAFSASERVEALMNQGKSVSLQSAFASVDLDSFGRCHRHRLRDVSRIVVGTHPLRRSGPLA